MSDSPVEPFDWEKRKAEKEASRRQDAADLASGKVTPEELRRRNSAFGELAKRVKMDLRGAKRLY